MDFPGAQALSERMKRLIPPKLLEDQQDPAVAAISQENEQLKAALAAMQQELQSKQAETQVKAQDTAVKAQIEASKLQLEQQKINMDYEIKQAELALKARELDLKESEALVSAVANAQQQPFNVIPQSSGY